MIHEKYSFAVVTARGGSERLPGKNKMILGGKSLFVWSVEAALDSGVFDEVWVSSDDQDIIEIAGGMNGVKVDERPAELCGSGVPGSEVLTYMIEKAVAPKGKGDHTFCLLQPTSPFRNGAHIQKAMETLNDDQIDYVVGLKEYGIPPQFALCMDGEGVFPAHEGYLTKITHTQKVPVSYHLAGGLYAGRCETFLTAKSFYGKRTRGICFDAVSGWDINTPDEFKVAQALAAQLYKEQVGR